MKRILLAIALCLMVVATAWAAGASDDLIKLARSGVDGEVLLAYVDSSPEPFELSADDIITLKDLGVPAKVVSAALRRGQVLDSLAAANGTTTVASDTGAAGDSAQAAALLPAAAPVAPPTGSLNISFFYDALAPYGNWIQIDGDWCWQPNAVMVSADWAPYCSHGHWVYTDWGWCWVSDYTWGWAPFHYGRWFRHSRHGWCWLPDTEWGPAWVAWRHSADYWGWAPLPRHIRYVRHEGYYSGKRRLRHGDEFKLTGNDYFFLPTGHFADPRPWVHIVPPRRGLDIFKRTTFITDGFGDEHDHIFNRGPAASDIATASNKAISPIAIVHDELKPGQPIPRGTLRPGRLDIYGPVISPDVPRPPAVVPPGSGGLTDIIAQRRQIATQQTLDQQKAAAATANRERKVLIDSARREPDVQKRTVFKNEAQVRDLRAQQAEDNIARIKQWKAVPAIPMPQAQSRPEPPQLKYQLKNQVQTDAKEEQRKQQVMEDLIRRPAVANPPPSTPNQPPAIQNPPPATPNQPPVAPRGGANQRNEER